MTIVQLINTFTLYGADTLLLALLTTLCVSLVKKLFFKKADKKLLTFLPFFVGTLFYCGYSALAHRSFYYVYENFSAHMERGFAVGAAATVLYIIYEQFVRGDTKTPLAQSVAEYVLSGYVKSDDLKAVAQKTADAVLNDVTGSGAERVRKIVGEYAEEGTDEREVVLLSKTLCDVLNSLKSSQK